MVNTMSVVSGQWSVVSGQWSVDSGLSDVYTGGGRAAGSSDSHIHIYSTSIGC